MTDTENPPVLESTKEFDVQKELGNFRIQVREAIQEVIDNPTETPVYTNKEPVVKLLQTLPMLEKNKQRKAQVFLGNILWLSEDNVHLYPLLLEEVSTRLKADNPNLKLSTVSSYTQHESDHRSAAIASTKIEPNGLGVKLFVKDQKLVNIEPRAWHEGADLLERLKVTAAPRESLSPGDVSIILNSMSQNEKGLKGLFNAGKLLVTNPKVFEWYMLDFYPKLAKFYYDRVKARVSDHKDKLFKR